MKITCIICKRTAIWENVFGWVCGKKGWYCQRHGNKAEAPGPIRGKDYV